MSEIEKLTAEERAALEWPMPHRAEAKALRIIDAQAARIAEQQAMLDAVWDCWEMAQIDPATRSLALEQIGDLLRESGALENEGATPHCSACEDYPDLGPLQCTVCGRTGG
jgi:hypothetical protein